MQAQAQQSGVGPSRGWAAAARARPQLPRPAFGSSPNLQALVLEAEERAEGPSRDANLAEAAFYEVTIASADQPKLLSRLSEALVSSFTQCPGSWAFGCPWLLLEGSPAAAAHTHSSGP